MNPSDDSDTPETLVEAIRHFADPEVTFQFVKQMRWPDGVVKCPRCQSEKVGFISTRRSWECKCCTSKKQFSVRTGTIFEDSLLPLDKWLVAIWMLANSKNGISSYEVARGLGITQKSAWFMLQRIRLAMQTGTFLKFKGQVEVDETLIGGKARNMHKAVKNRRMPNGGTGSVGKEVVMGLLERSGKDRKSQVRALHVPSQRRHTLDAKVREHVEKQSEVFTDSLASYDKLSSEFQHQFINHAESYVDGQVHTNGMENFWSLLKRSIKGTYVSIEPFHLFRYLDEQVFRFNKRGYKDHERFRQVLAATQGRKLTYKHLTGREIAPT